MNSKRISRKSSKPSSPGIIKPSGAKIIRPAPLTGAASPYQQRAAQFPPAWLWLVDEALPTLVKKNYSPKDSWKDKPFTKEDAGFFFKGIQELSELFTEERSKGLANYFNHPKFRSSYLLYFLPLQAAKFLTIYQLHFQAIEAALDHAEKTGVLRIVDLGAGPGTASISLLLLLLNQKMVPGKSLPRIELEWFDTQESIMADGKALVEQLASSFPKLRGKVTVKTHCTPWWKAPSILLKEAGSAGSAGSKEKLDKGAPNSSHQASLILMGHVLNESTAPQRDVNDFWEKLVSITGGGGILLVEPAARRPSQGLSKLRDHFFESGLLESSPTRIWGPCLHAGACPLSDGRDWCHFSVPANIPGSWFRGFSEGLGSERQWVKFSYVWIASAEYPSPQMDPRTRRVISDPLNQGTAATYLLCEPEEPGRWVSPNNNLGRGDLIKI
jgi:hypothetical protein